MTLAFSVLATKKKKKTKKKNNTKGEKKKYKIPERILNEFLLGAKHYVVFCFFFLLVIR